MLMNGLGEQVIGRPAIVDHPAIVVGPQLRSCCPQGVGGLQLVSRLDTWAASSALADVNVKTPDDRPAGNLDLILLIDVILFA